MSKYCTPKLSQKDIESLGFKFITKGPILTQYRKNYLVLYQVVGTEKVSIKNIKTSEYLFQGVCKNKSELVKLLKQLNTDE